MDDLEWCRIYPVPARYLEQKLRRWDVIDALVWQDPSHDPRPESWKIDPASIETVGHIGTGAGSPPEWRERKEYLLNPGRCFSSVEALRDEQRSSGTSLGIVTPREGAHVAIQKRPVEDRDDWESKHDELLAQEDLFDRPKELDYMPYRPVIRFRCAGTDCKGTHNCAVLDWEIYQLARREGWDAAKTKLEELLDLERYDARLIMGNFRQYLYSFGIVGLWYPMRGSQGVLF